MFLTFANVNTVFSLRFFIWGTFVPLQFHVRGHVKILGDIPWNGYFFPYCACELFIKCCLEFSSSMMFIILTGLC